MTPERFNRRDFLKFSAAFAGAGLLGLVEPPSKAMAETGKLVENTTYWSDVTIREGDTFESICKFYGVPIEKINETIRINSLKDRNDTLGETIRLPIPTTIRDLPFKQMIVPVRGNLCPQSFTDNFESWNKYSDQSIFYDLRKYPYVLLGHSSLVHPELYVFHQFLRELKDNKGLKINFWLSRRKILAERFDEEDEWIQFTTGYEMLGYASKWSDVLSSAHSGNLILITCAVETKNPNDVFYARAEISRDQEATPNLSQKVQGTKNELPLGLREILTGRPPRSSPSI